MHHSLVDFLLDSSLVDFLQDNSLKIFYWIAPNCKVARWAKRRGASARRIRAGASRVRARRDPCPGIRPLRVGKQGPARRKFRRRGGRVALSARPEIAESQRKRASSSRRFAGEADGSWRCRTMGGQLGASASTRQVRIALSARPTVAGAPAHGAAESQRERVARSARPTMAGAAAPGAGG